MNSLFKFNKKFYFTYPCPRKLREIVKMTMFEREQSHKIKDLWKTYYAEKPRAFGLDIESNEMELMVKK
jgi:ATP synthase F1 complex assembly factor 1